MSNYIRTENDIYECAYISGDNTPRIVGREGHTPISYTIIKEADTIEELCDCLVVISKDKPNEKKITDVWCLGLQYKFKDDFITTYGAVWTNKGLIYVAKMNDKGELCLI